MVRFAIEMRETKETKKKRKCASDLFKLASIRNNNNNIMESKNVQKLIKKNICLEVKK